MLTASSITSKEGTREKKRGTTQGQQKSAGSTVFGSSHPKLILYTGPPQARISKRMSTLKELDQKAD